MRLNIQEQMSNFNARNQKDTLFYRKQKEQEARDQIDSDLRSYYLNKIKQNYKPIRLENIKEHQQNQDQLKQIKTKYTSDIEKQMSQERRSIKSEYENKLKMYQKRINYSQQVNEIYKPQISSSKNIEYSPDLIKNKNSNSYATSHRKFSNLLSKSYDVTQRAVSNRYDGAQQDSQKLPSLINNTYQSIDNISNLKKKSNKSQLNIKIKRKLETINNDNSMPTFYTENTNISKAQSFNIEKYLGQKQFPFLIAISNQKQQLFINQEQEYTNYLKSLIK
eukprot:403331691